MSRPTIGRIVLYGEPLGIPAPAIVIDYWDAGDERLLTLRVLSDLTTRYNVSEDPHPTDGDKGRTPAAGYWCWPVAPKGKG